MLHKVFPGFLELSGPNEAQQGGKVGSYGLHEAQYGASIYTLPNVK